MQTLGDVRILLVKPQPGQRVEGGEQARPPKGELELEPVGWRLAVVVLVGLEETAFQGLSGGDDL